jgi:uncharacterized membrane protein YgdD (TMEM256/DUF423 family)
MPKLFLLLASANGFLAVALGAFAAHGLKSRLDANMLQTFQTGVQYHMSHALALFAVALLSLYFPAEKLPRIAGYSFLLGILLFSGSLYVLSLSGTRWLGAITPFGGVAFLVGWGCLFWFALTRNLIQ